MEKKILVVDDDEVIRYMYKKTFKNAGYSVRSAETAEEALEILQVENIQVMFLDLNLPGMSGLELCRQIRSSNPIALLYAVTGYTSIFEFAACREAGFDDYFKKPVDINLLLKGASDAFEKLDRWIKR
jgi:CheY-like chemotaxis protein